jgi:3-carboxy-cis,cis-muconate cycloisomerase
MTEVTVRPVGQPWTMLQDTFGDPEMTTILSQASTVRGWSRVESALAQAQGRLGVIPRAAAEAIVTHIASLDIPDGALTPGIRHVGYPIVDLLAAIGRDAPTEDVAAYLHWGATTQDIMDTGLALQLAAALDRLEVLATTLGDITAALAQTHRPSVMAARTHGQQAVPTTFGAKVATWLAELTRQLDRLVQARPRVAVVQLFGAGGTAAAMGPRAAAVRAEVAELLGLAPTDVPWHTARDGIAEACALAASLASTCVRIAREVVDLARTEVGEVHETLSHGRGASSTMPQKANPILSESIVGMGSIAVSLVPAMLTAMQVRHERAAGEWQIEWDVIPLIMTMAAGSLGVTAEMLGGLEVDPVRMRANLDLDGGLVMAEALMMGIAPVAGRARAHALVYDLCARARREGRSLRDVVATELPPDLSERLPDVATLLDPAGYLGEAEAIVDAALAAWRVRRKVA